MAVALCSGCGQQVRWYGGRGCKLSDVRSRCCGATVVAKPAKKGHRGDPALMLDVRLGDYRHEPGAAVEQVWTTGRVRVALLADGRVQFGKWWRRYAETGEVEDGWRHFTCPRTDTHNYYCQYQDRAMLREEDYLRLLTKAGRPTPA